MKYYRLLAMLPALPEAPEPPPIALADLVGLYEVDLTPADNELALTMLGFLDCRNVEAWLQGYDVFDDRAPLSRERLEERRDLPSYLEEFLAAYESGGVSDAYPFDQLWRAYFGFLAEVAETGRSTFLKEWATYEITLRDALVRQRAEALGEKAELRVSGVSLEEGESHAPLLSALTEAANPMERERVIDVARLGKIQAISGIDPFSTDSALAYLAAMLILDRWDIGKTADVSKMLEVLT